MKSFLLSYTKFDSFLKWQLCVGLINSLTWALCIPIIYKLQGMYWSTAYISIYLICVRLSGLLVPMFKGIHIKKLYLHTMILNVVYVLSLFIYFYNIKVFLFIEVLLSIIYCIIGTLLGIGWDVYVVDKYEKKVFEDFRYWESIKDSLGGILGSGIVGLMSIYMDHNEAIKVFMFAMVLMLIAQQLNWKRNYKSM